MSKKVTMRDIAKKLNISAVAVSKALTDKSGISDELRRKVKKTAEQMGYVYSKLQNKKALTSNNIGIIAAERYLNDNSFYFKFIRRISADLQKHNYCTFFHTLTDSDEENAMLPDVFFNNGVDGMIVLGQISDEFIRAVIDTDIPVVFLDFYNEFTTNNCIVCDSFYAIYEMTNYLIRNGHKKIGYVGNTHSTSSIQDRYLGYIKSLIEHNIPIHDPWVISDRSTETGRFIPMKLPDIMPTAFVCNCDETAYRFVTLLKENGYRVPEDISVTGFDNSVYSSICVPNITTVEVNTAHMSEVAVEALLKRIKLPSSPLGMIQVKGKMMLKDSVASLNYK